MKFIGTVVYLKRQDHAGREPGDQGMGPKTVMDVRLNGQVHGHPVWIELAVPTREIKSYAIGRRVVVIIRPR